jgi:hypothetical protein
MMDEERMDSLWRKDGGGRGSRRSRRESRSRSRSNREEGTMVDGKW